MTVHRLKFVYQGQEFIAEVDTDRLCGLAYRARKSKGRRAVEASGALVVTPGKVLDLAARVHADYERVRKGES